MTKNVLLIVFIGLAVSFNVFADEEEPAQTNPTPLMHQKMVSKKNHSPAVKSSPKRSGGKLFADEEGARTRLKPIESKSKILVPDEEEEETGIIHRPKTKQVVNHQKKY